MKLSLLNHEVKLRQLNEELEYQKRRFTDSTLATGERIQETSSQLESVLEWIRSHPIQTAGLLFVGGFLITQLIYSPEAPIQDL